MNTIITKINTKNIPTETSFTTKYSLCCFKPCLSKILCYSLFVAAVMIQLYSIVIHGTPCFRVAANSREEADYVPASLVEVLTWTPCRADVQITCRRETNMLKYHHSSYKDYGKHNCRSY